MPPHASKIPPLLAEKLAAGELSPERVRALKERHDLDDEALGTLIASLRADNQAILDAHPARIFCEEVEVRAKAQHVPRRAAPTQARPSSSAWRHGLAIAATLTLTAGVVLFLSSDQQISTQLEEGPTIEDTVRLKGPATPALTPHEERLRIWRAQRPSATQLEPGDTVNEGDTLQIEYVMPHDARPGLILSIDGEGTVTLHHPSSLRDAPLLEQGTHRLPYSYTLDDAPLFERFIMVECTHEVDLPRILEAFEHHASGETFASAPRTSSPSLPDTSCSIQADQTFDKRSPGAPSTSP